jgi:aryl-alcohol dehydrogenase-like predicted oxidoreductase
MKLALGTAQFGMQYGVANITGRVASETARIILRRAQSCDIDTLDTAIDYGNSESVLGGLGIGSFKVISKLPAVPPNCSNITNWAKDLVKGSLERLGVKRLHGLLLHRPNQLLESIGQELYFALETIKEEGLVDKIGLSIYRPSELEDLWTNYQFDLIQSPINILDRRLFDSGWMQQLKETGVEIHARSIFLQGLLLIPSELRPARFSPWSDIWREWDRWLNETGLTPVEACLHYVNSKSEIDCVIVGVDSLAQLDQIISAANGTLGSFPKFKSLQDDILINPATWNQL